MTAAAGSVDLKMRDKLDQIFIKFSQKFYLPMLDMPAARLSRSGHVYLALIYFERPTAINPRIRLPASNCYAVAVYGS